MTKIVNILGHECIARYWDQMGTAEQRAVLNWYKGRSPDNDERKLRYWLDKDTKKVIAVEDTSFDALHP